MKKRTVQKAARIHSDLLQDERHLTNVYYGIGRDRSLREALTIASEMAGVPVKSKDGIFSFLEDLRRRVEEAEAVYEAEWAAAKALDG
jgi:hypothetical protein